MADDYPQWFNEWLRRRLPSTTSQQDAGKMMRRMLDGPEWGLVEELLSAREAREMADLQRPGKVPEHVDFAHGHGVIEGLRCVRGAAEAVIKVAESADRKAREAAESAG